MKDLYLQKFLTILFVLFYFQTSIAQCVVVPNQNTVYGNVYADFNENGIHDALETIGIGNIGIDLYQDSNTNGLIDIGETVVASTLSNGAGDYALVAPDIIVEENVADYFDAVSFSGNNGSVNWSNSWQQTGETDGPSSGHVRITNALRFGDDDDKEDLDNWGVYRIANLSTSTSATLSFDFDRQISDNDSNKKEFYVRVQVSTNGSTYTTLDNLGFYDTDQNYSYNISAYMSSTTYIRFIGWEKSEKVANYLFFDNITVEHREPNGFFTNYVAAIDNSTVPLGTTVTSATFIPITFTGLGQMSCDNDFGGFICGPNCTPNAQNDNITVLQGESIDIPVLDNDTDGDGNIDNSTLVIITQPTNGSVSLDGLGNVIYSPNGNYFGTDSFQYQICDTTSPTPLCDSATVNVTILENIIDPCLQAVKEQTYYIPFPDDDLRTALANASNGTCGALTNFENRLISIKNPYPGTIITYDHWEDGYEADINNPVQATTQVWGDDDITNGTSPSYSDDYIPSGGNLVLQNTFNYNPRNPLEIVYDGRDKISTSNEIALSVIAGDIDRFNIQLAKTNVYNIDKYGTSFTVPFGEDLLQEFVYTALFIRAANDGTMVNVDVDNDGVIDNTATLNEGEVLFVDGGVQSGASVTSSAPVGVELFFGDQQCFGTRQINILPGRFYSDTYYSPVPTTNVSAPSVVYFYNSLSQPIDINWSSNINTGTINVPAKSSSSISLSDNSGYKFQSSGGESFVASQIIDSDASGTAYDWGFNLISEDRLADFAAVAWAPGSLDMSANYNPVWVTPVANTTIYIKYDGDLTDAAALTSPCGIPYDQTISINALDYAKIFDTFNNDNDQSGMALYTCDGTKIFSVYGQDASLAPAAGISIDVGTSMQPLCLQSLVLANDDKVYCLTNTTIEVPVSYNDSGFLSTLDLGSVSTNGLVPPQNGVVSVNPNGNINYTPNFAFIGQDTFEYQICSVENPGACDTATVSIIISDCPAPAYGNILYGQIYFDENEDLLNNDGIGISDICVNMYEDVNIDGVVDAGDIFLDVVPTNEFGFYNYVVPNYYIEVSEDFSTSNYSGGIGWAGNWIEVGDDNNPATGSTQITSTPKQLLIQDGNQAYRAIDLSGVESSNISFEVKEFGSIDPTDTAIVDICSDATFTNCQTLFIKSDDFIGASINGTVVEPDKLTNTAVFRARTTGYTGTEIFYIDNIIIRNEVNPLNLVIEADLTTIPVGYIFSTDNIETANFTAGATGECERPNDFGLLRCTLSDDPSINLICDDNGTPYDASDDSFSISVDPVGTRVGATYNVTGDITGSGTYGSPQVFGPYLVSSGDKIFTITDETGNCSIKNIEANISESYCLTASAPTSVDFDGVDDYLSTPGLLNGLQEVTMMAWVKIDPTDPGGFKHIIVGEDVYCSLAIESSGTPSFTVRTDITPTIAVNANPIAKGEWHHITGTLSSTSGESRIYVDGELIQISPTDFSGATITATGLENGNFEVGRFSRDSAPDQQYFFGSIDEVRVFDTALTESQIQRMVYQEIEQNGPNVKGVYINKDIVDISTNNTIPWSNLKAYYPMTDVSKAKTFDRSGNLRDITLYNIETIQPQTAPIPYKTVADGPWTAESTWLHGDVWDIEDVTNNKDWSIVNIKNNVTTAASHKHLGLIVDAGKTLTVGDPGLDDQDFEINNTWYLELNGTIDLQDDSQLIQGLNSDLVTGANGKILRRQEGTSNKYWYNYWSSPVGSLGLTTLADNNGPTNNNNNTPFNLDMIKDGNGSDIDFTTAYDETGKISTYWLYNFQNGITYYDWQRFAPTDDIPPGFGYTQKGIGNGGTEQQYTFEGKPNNGTILIAADDVSDAFEALNGGESVQDTTLVTSLVGNPYPSALDALQFIDDNVPANGGITSGTILLWEQWAGNTHYLAYYEGGYGFINNTTTERAYQHADIPIDGGGGGQGIKRPTKYIPVGQSFFVEVIADGDIEFNNGQRVFIMEGDALLNQTAGGYSDNGSVFFRTTNTDNPESGTIETAAETQILRLEFGVSSGASRSFVIGFSEDATDGYDYGLDGGLINDPPEDDMGSLLNVKQYVIQAFAPYTQDKEIDLVLKASGNFTYTLKATEISNFPEDQDIFLKDNLLDLHYNLRNTDPYSFTSEAGSFTDRFQVIFQDPSTLSTEEFLSDTTLIYVNQPEAKLYVKQLTQQARELSISNMLGQRIKIFNSINNQTLENGIDISGLSSGVYIVSIKTENDRSIDKKVIIN